MKSLYLNKLKLLERIFLLDTPRINNVAEKGKKFISVSF